MPDIEFWFDFSSPYAFFSSLEVEAVATKHGRSVEWRPMLLGRAFQITGMQPLGRTPLRGDYARHDWARMARRMGVAFRLPRVHPVVSTAAGRTFLWLEGDRRDLAVPFARAVFFAGYVDGADIGDCETVIGIAAGCGADASRLRPALSGQALKERFRAQTEQAVNRGVFGAPFFFVDGEPFWGCDRLPLIDDWLAAGGW